MKFLSNFIKGLAVGIGAIIPGVSGGTLAVIFGIYEKLTDTIANIFTEFKSNLRFLLPVALGAGIGILAFGRIMKYMLENHNTEIRYLFIGLIAGTFPEMFKQANKHGFKNRYILPFATTLLITIVFTVLENRNISIAATSQPSMVQLVIYGAIIGFGTIIPGISASVILMYIGGYQVLLDAVSNINIAVLIPAGLGFILSVILFAKLISLLFKNAYGFTYYAVLGFVLGSILPIFPGIAFSLSYLICLLILITGFYLSFYLSRYGKAN